MNLRHEWYRFKYLHGQHLPLKVPVDLLIEFSSLCDLRCKYCYQSSENRPFNVGLIREEIAKMIFTQGAKLGVNSYKVNWRGEATLHPKFRELSEFGASLASGSTYIDRIINSNFNFEIRREDILRGLQSYTKVKISFDTFNKEILESQRVRAKYERIVKNIHDFYHYPNRKNEMVIQAVRTTKNYNEDIEGEVKRLWPSAKISIRDVVAGRKEESIGDLEHRTRDFDNRQPCKQAFVRLIINHDGEATVCCPDITSELSLGNVKDKSLYQLFNSEKAKQIRKELKSGKAFLNSPCKNCPSFESYKGYKAPWTS